ncbi:hamartin-like [Lytechinus pictus]|uniref:hamartin-like n=1 Tax=Lytechinus pictus TaxID=7653 RepID=UPI0030B9C156
MAHHQHVTEPTALFPHLESNDLHTVKEFKSLIQDNLTSAREPSFLNALVDFYIQTNSSQAQDVLSGLREPLDKPLMDKLNECMKYRHSRLPALNLISHIVRHQPTWLHKIVQAPLFTSMIQCLKVDTDIPVLMCGILAITTLLPMIPSKVGPFLHDICEIFARLASWSVHKPGEVHDVHQLHLQAAVYALFHRLYGMYPWNFLEFLQSHFANREKEFEVAVLPMLERVRMHPQLIVGQKAKETDLARWRKMEVHDILMECARVCLDTTESTRDDRSTCGLSLSESGSGMAYNVATRSNVSSSCKTSSPGMIPPSSDAQILPASKQTTPSNLNRKPDVTSNLISSQAILSAMWSPAVDCGLTTPPTSHPPSPGGSMMDLSLTSSLQMGYGDPSSSLTTPRDSPHSTLGEEQPHRVLNISEGSTPNKSGRKSRGKGPGALPRYPPNILQRTTSAPSTPGYDANSQWLPASPIRKYSADRTIFNFGNRSSAQHQASKPADGGGKTSAPRSRQSSGKESGIEESVLEDSIEEEKGGQIKCPKPRQEDDPDDQESSVSLKDLPSLIRHLSDSHLRSDDATNAEVSSIVNSPQRNVGEFMSKIMAGLHHHKESPDESDHLVLNSTPKYEVEKQSGQVVRGTAEGADDVSMSVEGSRADIKGRDVGNGVRAEETGMAGVDSTSSSGDADAALHELHLEESSPCQKEFQKVSHNLFGAGTANGTVHEEDSKRREVSEEGKMAEDCELGDKITDSALSRQHRGNQGFTPIRDCSVDSMESPYPAEMSTASQHAYASINSMLRQALPYYMYTPTMGTPAPTSQDIGDEISLASSDFSRSGPLHAVFSPAEMLDRHINMSDDVHDKELSRLPLTSQKSVNWTHYGGSPPADEINLLKGQLQLLHNQLLYERHKREVHAGRNRRLLGKTHKAKAYEELNSAMKDQLRLQENEIAKLSAEVNQVRLENRQLTMECHHKDKNFQQAVQKLEAEKVHLTECKEELNKLLVTHRLEVDKVKKDLKVSNSSLFDIEQELASARGDIATNNHLKDEIKRLNKEILLLGETNTKYKEKIEESKLSKALVEEEDKRRECLKKELADCHDAARQKSIQLEAAKARITEIDALLIQRDRSIAEQKRYLESVKSLSNGKIEAMEAKYNSLKKVTQRLEGELLKPNKHRSEQCNSRRDHAQQRSNPDGAQLEDSTSSSGISRSRSNSPQKMFSRSGSTGSQKSRPDPAERRTPLGDEGAATALANVRTSRKTSTPTPKQVQQATQEGSKTPSPCAGELLNQPSVKSRSKEGPVNGKTNKMQSSAIRFSEASPFQRVHSVSSAPSNLAPNAPQGNASHERPFKDRASAVASNSCHSCPEFDKLSQHPAGSLAGSPHGLSSEGSEDNNGSPSNQEGRKANAERTAIVDDIGCGVGSQGIASHLELDASVEEHGLSHW